MCGFWNRPGTEKLFTLSCQQISLTCKDHLFAAAGTVYEGNHPKTLFGVWWDNDGLFYRITVRQWIRWILNGSENKDMSLLRSWLYGERKKSRDGKGVILMQILDVFSPQTNQYPLPLLVLLHMSFFILFPCLCYVRCVTATFMPRQAYGVLKCIDFSSLICFTSAKPKHAAFTNFQSYLQHQEEEWKRQSDLTSPT